MGQDILTKHSLHQTLLTRSLLNDGPVSLARDSLFLELRDKTRSSLGVCMKTQLAHGNSSIFSTEQSEEQSCAIISCDGSGSIFCSCGAFCNSWLSICHQEWRITNHVLLYQYSSHSVQALRCLAAIMFPGFLMITNDLRCLLWVVLKQVCPVCCSYIPVCGSSALEKYVDVCVS